MHLTHTGPGQPLAGKLLTIERQMHAFNSYRAWAATGTALSSKGMDFGRFEGLRVDHLKEKRCQMQWE